jgi:hypothetical protein
LAGMRSQVTARQQIATALRGETNINSSNQEG